MPQRPDPAVPRRARGAPPRELDRLLETRGRGRPRLVLPPPPARNAVAGVVWITVGCLPFVFLLGIIIARLLGGAGPPQFDITGAGRLAREFAASGSFGAAAKDARALLKRLEATGLLERGHVRRPLLGPAEIVVLEKTAVALLPTVPPLALGSDGTVLGPASPADAARAGVADLPVVRCGDPEAPGFSGCARLSARLAAILLSRPDLDRFVSELDASAGALRVAVTLRPWPVTLLVTEERFEEGLEATFGHLPDLLLHWSDLFEVDARVADRLLLRLTPDGPGPVVPTGGGVTS